MKLAVVEPADQPINRFVRVTLDGLEITRWCISADEGAGMAVVLKLTPEGQPTITIADTPATETLYGVVEITLRPEAPEPVKKLYLARRIEEAV